MNINIKYNALNIGKIALLFFLVFPINLLLYGNLLINLFSIGKKKQDMLYYKYITQNTALQKEYFIFFIC